MFLIKKERKQNILQFSKIKTPLLFLGLYFYEKIKELLLKILTKSQYDVISLLSIQQWLSEPAE